MRRCDYKMKRLKKELIKRFLPQALLQVIRRKQHFISWWSTFQHNAALPAELVEMVNYYISSSNFKMLHESWKMFCKINIEQIAKYGLENFKQTAAKNYFTWTGYKAVNYWYKKLIANASLTNQIINFAQVVKKHALLTYDESIQQNIITIALYEQFKKEHEAYLLNFEEPEFGNPAYVSIDNKRITQDLINSLSECITITREIPKIKSVIEIGAGSGRTAWCFLKMIPGLKYVIVDIPPALFLSQQFLLNQFVESHKIFRFRPFASYTEIANQFETADIAFITPDQLRELPNRLAFDLFLAIDCLSEMTKRTVKNYFKHADRLARNIYFKSVSFEYQSLPQWRRIFERKCNVPEGFIEAFFSIPR